MTRKETRGGKYDQKLRKALEQKRIHSSRGRQVQRIKVLGQCTVLTEYMSLDTQQTLLNFFGIKLIVLLI